MEVKHGKIKIRNEWTTGFHEYLYDIYQKTDGNYVEYLLNQTQYKEGSIQDGQDVIEMSVAEDEYKVYPNATLDNVLSKLPSSNYTWEQQLTII